MKALVRGVVMMAGVLGCGLAALAGPLDPPAGPIAPTGKPLQELEPRIMVSDANTPGDSACVYRITRSGSYYLGGNLQGVSSKSGIIIAAENVTLDLNGFVVQGVTGSLTGIALSTSGTFNNVAVRSGTIDGWGTSGVDLAGNFVSQGSRLENLTASNCKVYGLRSGGYGIVRNCNATRIGPATGVSSYGVIGFSGSTVDGCSASNSTGYGVVIGTNGLLRNSSAVSCSIAGISALGSAQILNCSATNNPGVGITCYQDGNTISGVQIIDCVANANQGGGIELSSQSSAVRCLVSNNLVFGIRAKADRNLISDNSISKNALGVWLIGTSNVVIRNALIGNDQPTSAVSGNDIGPLNSTSLASNPWSNILK